jgi:hypothetical protein
MRKREKEGYEQSKEKLQLCQAAALSGCSIVRLQHPALLPLFSLVASCTANRCKCSVRSLSHVESAQNDVSRQSKVKKK